MVQKDKMIEEATKRLETLQNMDLQFGEFGSIQFDVIQGGLVRTN